MSYKLHREHISTEDDPENLETGSRNILVHEFQTEINLSTKSGERGRGIVDFSPNPHMVKETGC